MERSTVSIGLCNRLSNIGMVKEAGKGVKGVEEGSLEGKI